MASPFRTFRKNQKVWMAVITLMAIVAFVFMAYPTQNSGRGGGQQAAVVQTRFRSLTQIEIANLRSQRHSLIEFLLALDQHFSADSKNSQNSQQADRAVRAFLNLLGPDTDEAAIDRWVYARTAESMGVVVDDRSVGEILSLIMLGEQDPQRFLENALRNFGPGMNPAVLVEVMRQQLLALRLMQLGHQYDDWAGFSASPGERWDYFKRLRQEASIEVALLMPKDFTKGVKDPTDRDLEEFFDKYKNVESSSDSPDPGFRIPRKVNVEYLEADKSKIKDQITDAEISEEYDKDPKIYARDKEEAEQEEKQEKEDREKADKEEAAKAAAEKKGGTDAKKNDVKPETKPENKGAAKPETKSAVKPEATPAAKPQTSPAPKVEPKSEAKPDTLKSPAKPATTGAKPAGATLSAPRSPFRLVAFTDEKAADKTPGKAPATPVTDNNAAAPPAAKPSDAKPSDSKKPAPDASSAAKTVATLPAKADGKQETKTADAKKPADRAKSVEGSSAAGKKDVREPIKTAQERLRESIRNSLATRRFQENVTKVKGVLEAYYTDLGNAAEGNKPAPPDFAALAKEYTMTAHKTGLLSMRQLKETDFGKSQVSAGYADVAGELFGPTTLYKPGTSYKQSIMSVTEYIYWKTDDQPERVPKWTDPGVKEKVLQEWKLIQARKLALDAANDLKAAAEKKENAGKPLKTLAAGKKDIDVVQPPKFSWLTRSPTDQSLELSSVGDLTKPGAEFMKQVFSMRPGQVTVATNVAKSELYVVRMIEFTPFRDLWDEFILPETAQDYMSLLVPTVRNEVDPAWRAQVLRDAKNTKESKKPDDGQPATPPDEPEGPPPPEDY